MVTCTQNILTYILVGLYQHQLHLRRASMSLNIHHFYPSLLPSTYVIVRDMAECKDEEAIETASQSLYKNVIMGIY
jgi:hypothetical protein